MFAAAAAKRTALAAASVFAVLAVSILVPAGGAASERRDHDSPTTPANVRVVAALPSLVQITWDPSVDNVSVAGYYVYGDKVRGTDEKNPGRVVVEKPEYSVRGLRCGESAVIGVVAFDDSQNRSEKASSTVSTAACLDTQPPTAPSGFTQVATSEDAVVLAWNPSSDNVSVVEYGVYRDLQRTTTSAEPKIAISGLSCGSTYPYSVDAADAAGNRSQLAQVYVRTAACAPSTTPPPPPPSGDTTPPSAPTGLSASNVTQTGLTLGWNASSDNVGVTGYDVYRNGTKVASTTTMRTSNQSGLVCGSSYGFAVVARDAAGNSSPQAQLTATTAACSTSPPPSPPPPSGDTTPPSAPTGLNASNVTQTGLTLGWNASTDNVGVTGYDVYRNATKVASGSSRSANQTGLTCGTSYAFAVVARDAAGNSSSQAQLSASTAACSTPPPPPADTTPPSAPTGLAISSSTRTSVALSWNASTDNVGVQGYQTWVNGALASTTLVPGSTVTSLSCGTAYTFEVGAFDGEGNRSPRVSVIGSTSACPDTQAPTAPANLVATSRAATSIALSWSVSSDNVGVTGYGLYRGGSQVGTSGTTTAIFSGLTCNTNYTLAVDAFDAAGNRSSKTTVMVSTTACPDTTPPTAPTGLAVSSVTQTGLTLSWNASTDSVGVTGYDVYRNGTKMATVTSTSSAQTGLACGTAYTLAVVARDAAGNSSSQASLQASTSACSTPSTPPPPPSNWSAPITITQGGTYSGSWESTTSAPAIRIATTEPVVIQDSRVRNLTGARLIVSDWPLAVQLTLRRVQGFGGAGRFIELEGHKSFRMENCTLEKTSGVRLNLDAPGSTTVITRNRHHNIQHDAGSAFGNFVQFNWIRNGTIEVSWNEILNEYDQSHPEDILSLINTANASIHDNYLRHNSTPGNAYNTSSQGTITLEQGSRNNEIYANQLVDTVNGVYFGPAESDNLAHHNRLIQDGKLPNGTQMGNGYSGMSIHAGGSNNHMRDNVVGYVNRDGQRIDWWPMDPAEIALNTTLPNPITSETEQNEWTLWQQKVASAGITLGA